MKAQRLICFLLIVICEKAFAVNVTFLEDLKFEMDGIVYQKLVGNDRQGFNDSAAKCSELGPNWSPAIPNTADELENIRQGHLRISVTDINPYWIGDSSDTEGFIEYTEYRADDNGKYRVSITNLRNQNFHRDNFFLRTYNTSSRRARLLAVLCEEDACFPNPCQNSGTCTRTGGEGNFECSCTAGYSGTNCEILILIRNACSPNPCQNGGRCIRRGGEGLFECSCPITFPVINCINACSPNPCQNGGTCLRRDGGGFFECICPAGFSGTNCETNACLPNPCLNGGTCSITDQGHHKCSCPHGFSGLNCHFDACSPNPCQNGGICLRRDGAGFFECNCAAGFSGTNCIIDACSPNPCQNGGRCIGTYGGAFECRCSTGYSGKTCETNACTSNPCNNGGTCRLDMHGDSVCSCTAAFKGTTCERRCTRWWSACSHGECCSGMQCIYAWGRNYCENIWGRRRK